MFRFPYELKAIPFQSPESIQQPHPVTTPVAVETVAQPTWRSSVPEGIASANSAWELRIEAPCGSLHYWFDPKTSSCWQARDPDSETYLQVGFYQPEADERWRVSAIVSVIGAADSVCLIDLPYQAYQPNNPGADEAASGDQPSSSTPADAYLQLAYTLVDAALHLEAAATSEIKEITAGAAASAQQTPRALSPMAQADSSPCGGSVEILNPVFTWESWPTVAEQPAFAIDSLAGSRQAYWHDPAISADLQPWPENHGICPDYSVRAVEADQSEQRPRQRYLVVSACPGIGERHIPTRVENNPSATRRSEDLQSTQTDSQNWLHSEYGYRALVAAEAPYAAALVEAFAHCLGSEATGARVPVETGIQPGTVISGAPNPQQQAALQHSVTRAWHVPTESGFVRILETEPIWDEEEGQRAVIRRAAVYAPQTGYLGTLQWADGDHCQFLTEAGGGADWLETLREHLPPASALQR